jgi:glycolate oxidase FAD binding subunit
MARQLTPESPEAAAEALAEATRAGERVRIVGAGTKQGWGVPVAEPDVQLRTSGLDRIVEHNAGDLTAMLEAGVPLAHAQQAFAQAGQMLALDPWLGNERQATVGGVLATGDCGPLRHRYGAPRDLVLGMTVAFSDGAIARSGGRVIKNVAGYDLAKLFCGAFGTLGLILSVNVRLHPLPSVTVTATGESAEPETLAAAGRAIAAQPFELERLDVSWSADRGQVLAQCAGVAPVDRARRVAAAMGAAGLQSVDMLADDQAVWDAQRARQRSDDLALVRVAARPRLLGAVIDGVRSCGGSLVGRVALGTSYAAIDPDVIPRLRGSLPVGASSVLLDAPSGRAASVDQWDGAGDPAALELMRRVKARFDPAGTCNRGIFVGGI